MIPPRRILTVCLGNICRSPYAAAVLAGRGGDSVSVRSAGIRDKHAGQPAHPDMITVAGRRGYDLTGHRGQPVTDELLAWAEVVLAMDRQILADLHARGGPAGAKLLLYLDDGDVPDPWGGPPAGFTTCAQIIEDAAARCLTRAALPGARRVQ